MNFENNDHTHKIYVVHFGDFVARLTYLDQSGVIREPHLKSKINLQGLNDQSTIIIRNVRKHRTGATSKNSEQPAFLVQCDQNLYCVYFYVDLTNLSLVSNKRDTSKQCKPRSDAAERGVVSGSTLFAFISEISTKHDNDKK